MKFNKCFLKISKEVKLSISRWSLLHSLITDEKKIIFQEGMPKLKKCYVIWGSGNVQSTTTRY